MHPNMILKNNSTIHIENKIEQIIACIESIFDHQTIELVSITCDGLGYNTPNFTTTAILHLHGLVQVNHELKSWSLVLKIIKPDTEEKDCLEHHNYWRREALVLQSGVLQELPHSINHAKCYLVEEQQDGTIWLWMEYVEGEFACTVEQFSYIARQLGRFNGAYLQGVNTLPEHEWICRAWLKSWTTASRHYAPNMESYVSGLSAESIQNTWTWYQELLNDIDAYLDSLQQLPRVLAHQDLSQLNMMLVNTESSESRLVLIDWQFMSISGIGEDLGKLFGVNMSLGIIPPSQYQEFQDALFTSYIEGLRDMGWQGDARMAQYGFFISTALRSVWEVPQFLQIHSQLAEDPNNVTLRARFNQLEHIIEVHKNISPS
ncbi:phosphotransferase [Paenibacillus camelliae]|uniref:phosphotransferase n=1 Tax=Paenibacillus camelliae TaxID=512410 RepID=UPI00203F4B64|nr:phosphotransferase [Paenibacillus camelliae]MCM3633603.1 phosphotransferase [Paenibacillus camelliae]